MKVYFEQYDEETDSGFATVYTVPDDTPNPRSLTESQAEDLDPHPPQLAFSQMELEKIMGE